MIKDFVLLRYMAEGSLSRTFDDFLLAHAVTSLRTHHPQSTIHLLTNADAPADLGLVVHHRPDLPKNNLSKLEVFRLLDRPFMYMDIDVQVNRPFTDDHAVCLGDSPFSMFSYTSKRMDYSQLTPFSLPFRVAPRYNSGVMYVKWPSNRLYKRLMDISEMFSPDYYTNRPTGLGIPQDEVPISWLVATKKYNMPIRDDTNKWYFFCKDDELHLPQSVHFVGLEGKYRMRQLLKSQGVKSAYLL